MDQIDEFGSEGLNEGQLSEENESDEPSESEQIHVGQGRVEWVEESQPQGWREQKHSSRIWTAYRYLLCLIAFTNIFFTTTTDSNNRLEPTITEAKSVEDVIYKMAVEQAWTIINRGKISEEIRKRRLNDLFANKLSPYTRSMTQDMHIK